MKIKKQIITLLPLLLSINSCESERDNKKGVLEYRAYDDVRFYGTGTNFYYKESFGAINIEDDELDLKPGEIKDYNINGNTSNQTNFTSTNVQYIYHPDKSPSDLGYNTKHNENIKTHYKTTETNFVNLTKNGKYAPGENSGFGQISGAWKYPETGEVVWFDHDRSGKATLIHGGTKFPKEALRGVVFTEVTKTGQYTYRAKNHTYFPGTGWVPASYLNFEISKDGNTFKLGSLTWHRAY